jgi:hypothetical protein
MDELEPKKAKQIFFPTVCPSKMCTVCHRGKMFTFEFSFEGILSQTFLMAGQGTDGEARETFYFLDRNSRQRFTVVFIGAGKNYAEQLL